jgi:lipid-A-disaccharide synthase
VAAFNERQAAAVREKLPAGVPIDVHVGRTPEIIELADACASVSGSVSLELLYRAKPTVIVFRVNPLYKLLARRVLGVKYITLVNLLADEELFPELVTARDESDAIAGHLLGWLNDPAKRAALVGRLEALREWVAVPGACDRAAGFLLNSASGALKAAA